ncbi:hypothetical protein D3C77_545020 [compost metagenome]
MKATCRSVSRACSSGSLKRSFSERISAPPGSRDWRIRVSSSRRCSGAMNCRVKFIATTEAGWNARARISPSITSTGSSSWNIESWALRYCRQRSTMAAELSMAITRQPSLRTWRRRACVTAPSELPRSYRAVFGWANWAASTPRFSTIVG